MLRAFLGVYAFGFLFMLPQLFVNYKVPFIFSCLHDCLREKKISEHNVEDVCVFLFA